MQEFSVVTNIMKANEIIAAELRREFERKGIYVINFLGSPGAGKTSILEKLIQELKDEIKIAVIEGDVYTSKDAKRIEKQGVSVVQINTCGGCHLDSNMIKEALQSLDLDNVNLLVIENVGNLVCPAGYYLGEDMRMVALSITEGDDKPSKYPAMFERANLVVINKVDLMEHTNFSLDQALSDIKTINQDLDTINVSCSTGEGIDQLASYLKQKVFFTQE